jgi:hypothetical protein
MNAFSFFEKIYLINLEERKDRLENSLININNYEINNFEKFNGVKINENEYTFLSDKEKSQLGYSLSFYRIIRDAYVKNFSSILILEDDFEFIHDKENTNLFLKKSIDDLPSDWDVFYLGANIMYDYTNYPIEKFSDNLLKLNSAYCTHAISFSRRAILKILEIFSNESIFIEQMNSYKIFDIFLAKYFCINNSCFISREMLCTQTPGFSSIENCMSDYSDLKNRHQNAINNLYS